MPSIFRGAAIGSPSQIDRLLARQAIALLADPEAAVQLKAIPSGRAVLLPGRDLDGLVGVAASMDGGKCVYMLLNPVSPQLRLSADRNVRIGDILSRRWLLIDLDPKRPDSDSNATEEEHAAARAAAEAVMAYLSGQGWPAPVILDSGNGYHLLYRVDLPNDSHSRVLVKALLKKLAERFDTASVCVDTDNHPANRNTKLPGTWVRKGPASPERPHRMAQIVYAPEPALAVPVELIATEAGVAYQLEANGSTHEHTNGAAHRPFTGRATGSTEIAYGRAAIQKECARVALAEPGQRNTTLNAAAFSLGQLVGGKVIGEIDAVEALREAAMRCGLDSREAEGTIRSGLRAGKEQPRGVPERPNPARQPETPASASVPAGESIIVRASAIQPRKVEWLWPGRIPLGKLTTFAGVGGLGKTFVLCDITARVTQGADWPDSEGECCEPGQVLFVSGEDDPDDTLVPRLIELGADLNRVAFLRTEVADCFTLADLKTLDKAIEQIGKDVRFVAIDPPTAYLGGVDDHKNAELRGLLSPLKSWAARHRVALVFNTHVNKGGGQKFEAMMRVMGSVAWVNAVRAAHMFARDPHDPERRLFVGMKMNIGKERKGLAYRILATTDDLARVEWLGLVDTTADEAINRDAKPKKRSVQASEWLEELFAQESELPSKEIYARKKAETNISDDAIREAKDLMGIRAHQVSGDDGPRQWVWFWPVDARQRWQAKKQRESQAAGGCSASSGGEDEESF